MKKLKIVLIGLMSIFMLGSCGKNNTPEPQAITKEVAYAQILEATTELDESLDSFSFDAKGSATTIDMESKETKADIVVKMAYTTEEKTIVNPETSEETKGKVIKSSMSYIKLDTLILEGYYKDGYTYSYTNLIKDVYNYGKIEPGKADTIKDALGVSVDVDFTKILNTIKEYAPDPVGTVLNGTYEIKFEVTNENIDGYLKVYFYLDTGRDEDLDVNSDIEKIKSAIDIQEAYISLKIKDGRLINISAKAAIKAKNETTGIPVGESILKLVSTEVNASIEYSNVEIKFDSAHLEEIKQKVLEEKTEN